MTIAKSLDCFFKEFGTACNLSGVSLFGVCFPQNENASSFKEVKYDRYGKCINAVYTLMLQADCADLVRGDTITVGGISYIVMSFERIYLADEPIYCSLKITPDVEVTNGNI